jgi:hypothetical protein
MPILKHRGRSLVDSVREEKRAHTRCYGRLKYVNGLKPAEWLLFK